MKTILNRCQAFSLIELLIVIAIVAILVGYLVPSHLAAKQRAKRIRCVGNLKQIGVGFRLFANDHQGLYPSQVSTNKGGSREFDTGSDTFRHFLAAGNEIGVPDVLRCPSDTNAPAAAFSQFDNRHLSLFVNLNADEMYPNEFLAGDRNLTITNRELNSGVYDLVTNEPAGWSKGMHKFAGNAALADGSVQQFTSTRLNEQLQISDITNRVSIP